MGLKKENTKNKIWLYSGLAVAMIVNLIIALRPVFSYDESYTIALARNSFSEIVRITGSDVHAPLYYFAVKIVSTLMGGSVYGGRILSLLCLLVFVLVAWRACDGAEAKAWLLSFAFTQPLFVAQATESRMYTMALLFFTCANLLGYRLLEISGDSETTGGKTRTVWTFLGFTICSVLAIYMHTYTMLMMVLFYVGTVIYLAVKKQWKTMFTIIGSGVIVALSYVPWLLVLAKQFAVKTGGTSDLSGVEKNLKTTETMAIAMNEWFADFFSPNPMVWFAGIILALVLGYILVDNAIKAKEYKWINTYIIIAVILGITTYLVKRNPDAELFLGRYVFSAFGLLLIGQANGLAGLKVKKEDVKKDCKRFGATEVFKLVIIVACLFCGIWSYHKEYTLEDATGLQQYEAFLEENYRDGDVILANTRYQMIMSIFHPEYHYMVYGAVDNYSPYQNTEAFQDWAQLDGVEHVWALHFPDIDTADLSAMYDKERVLDFHYGYYDWNVEAWTRRE